jgi:hypothetical protein
MEGVPLESPAVASYALDVRAAADRCELQHVAVGLDLSGVRPAASRCRVGRLSEVRRTGSEVGPESSLQVACSSAGRGCPGAVGVADPVSVAPGAAPIGVEDLPPQAASTAAASAPTVKHRSIARLA